MTWATILTAPDATISGYQVTRFSNLDITGHALIHDDNKLCFGDEGEVDSYIKFADSGANLTFYDRTTGSKTLAQLAAGGTTETLQQAFANGKVITGANSSGNAFQVGDGTSPLLMYTNALNDARIITSGTVALTITSGTGTLSFGTNAVTTSGAISSTAGIITGTGGLAINANSVNLTLGANGASASYINYNVTNGLTFFDNITNSTYTLSQLASQSLSGPTFTGNVIISNGKLTWTDTTDEAQAWSFGNITTNGIVITETGVTTGTSLGIVTTTLTSGQIFKATATEGGGFTGSYFQATNAGSAVFDVKRYGAITIAGNAATAMLTVTAGDVAIANGKMTYDTTQDIQSYVKRNNATGTNPAFLVQETNAGGGVAFSVVSSPTNGSNAINVTTAGTGYALSMIGTNVGGKYILARGPASQTSSSILVDGTTGGWIGAATTGQLHVSSSGALATATTSNIYSVVTGTLAAAVLGACAYFYENTVSLAAGGGAVYIHAVKGHGLQIATSAAATSNIICTSGAVAAETASQVKLDGTTGSGFIGAASTGMLHLVCGKNLAAASTSLLYIAYSGTSASASTGSSINVVDTGANVSGQYAVGISATLNHAMKVATSAAATSNIVTSCGAVAAQTASSVLIDGSTGNGFVGAATTGMLHLQCSKNLAAASTSLLYIAYSGTSGAASAGSSINVVDTGANVSGQYAMGLSVTNNHALNIETKAAATTNINLICGTTAAQTTNTVLIDGNTGNGYVGAAGTGQLKIQANKAFATTTTSCLNITNSGTGVASTMGGSLRIVDTNSYGAGSYAMYISATNANTEALRVDDGIVVVDETLTASGGILTKVYTGATSTPPTQANMVTAFGAAATAGAGYIGIINSSGGDTNVYYCMSDGTSWFYIAGTKGV